jgi:two-component system response regulator AtoC
MTQSVSTAEAMHASATSSTAGTPRVMVVDDDAAVCGSLRSFFFDRGYQTTAVGNADEAVRRYDTARPEAVILELALPGRMNGFDALAEFKRIDRDVPVIVLSAQDRATTVAQAMKLGAADFVSKPFADTDLEVPFANALKQRQLTRETAAKSHDQVELYSKARMLFDSGSRMAEVQALIERVADIDVTVLVRGESGTGKELVARALSASVMRRNKPFVKVNCAALPTELLEAELFGFERGAFTGAVQSKPGKFEFANHGTMFLDEIGEMSPPLQAKLLQVLQDGEFSRLGGKHDVHVDVRVIAATNCDLERAVASGKFREDLFFRLNVVSISVPPLREHRQDIPILVDYFMKKYSLQFNKPCVGLSQGTMHLFLAHSWPGNVRELENMIKRAVVLGTEASSSQELVDCIAKADRIIAAAAFPSDGPAASARSYSLKEVSRAAALDAECRLIRVVLTETRWNRKETARRLGISYKALLYKIKDTGLDKPA